jgi:hypothetical protein
MAYASGFKHDYEVVRWAATQLPNLPHIQEHLRGVADGLEKSVSEAAAALIQVATVAAQSAANVEVEE